MLGLFGPKSGKIGVYKAAFIYQGPFKEGFSAGSPVINEVVLEGEFCEVQLRAAELRSVRRVMSSSCSHLSPVKRTNSSIKVTLRPLPTP
jgi:hypothetical protein